MRRLRAPFSVRFGHANSLDVVSTLFCVKGSVLGTPVQGLRFRYVFKFIVLILQTGLRFGHASPRAPFSVRFFIVLISSIKAPFWARQITDNVGTSASRLLLWRR